MQKDVCHWLSDEVTSLVRWPSVGVSSLAIALSIGSNSLYYVIGEHLQTVLPIACFASKFTDFSDPFRNFFFFSNQHLVTHQATFWTNLSCYPWRALPQEHKVRPLYVSHSIDCMAADMNELLTFSLHDHFVNIAEIPAQSLSLTYVSGDFARWHYGYRIRILAVQGSSLEMAKKWLLVNI